MKRSFLVSGGVLTGIASVLGLNPLHTGVATAATPTAATPAAAVKAATTTPTTAKTTSLMARTLTGSAINYQYGTVQVQLKVKGTKITAVTVLQAPSGRSQRFTDYSIPTLKAEVLKAQSANIAMVSGATFTSSGFIQSLASALKKI